MKRGTTAPALRHALVGNAFTAARRRGKQIILDTRDPDVRIGVHLGMSGRVLVDDEEAGDPLRLREQSRAWRSGTDSGCYFADGGDFMLRDPRRLGAVELDPDESRLGPDALTLSFAELDHALDERQRADQGRADGPAPHRGPRQPARRRDAVARRHCADPTRRPTIDAADAQGAAQGDPQRAAHARSPRWIAHRRHAARAPTQSAPATAHRCSAPPSAAAPPIGAPSTSSRSRTVVSCRRYAPTTHDGSCV